MARFDETARRRARLGSALLLGAGGLGSCSSDAVYSPPSLEHETWAIDCVAVLGMLRPSTPLPLESVPYSGVPRDKRFGELTEEELFRLCDFNSCAGSNGYQRECFHSAAELQLETVPLISEAIFTCRRVKPFELKDYGSMPSRENCMEIYRGALARCLVAASEDCNREGWTNPLAAPNWGPSCERSRQECGFP